MKSKELDLSKKQVLVTGGTGFIGGRLIERLYFEFQATVRTLVRNMTNAVRISRFPIEIIQGDVTNLDDVKRAAHGCDVIFHCAHGNQGSDEVRRLVNNKGVASQFSQVISGCDTTVNQGTASSIYSAY